MAPSDPNEEVDSAGPRLGELPGRWIVGLSWASTVGFVVVAAADRFGISALDEPAALVALSLFGVGLVVWLAAFGIAVARSTRDDVTLGGLFFLQGAAPRPVQVQLLGSLVVAIIVAGATATSEPFGVMEPILPLALAGLWGARHGTFRPRRDREPPGEPEGR